MARKKKNNLAIALILTAILLVLVSGFFFFYRQSIVTAKYPTFVQYAGTPVEGLVSSIWKPYQWFSDAGLIASDIAIIGDYKFVMARVRYAYLNKGCKILPLDAKDYSTLIYVDNDKCQHWSYNIPSSCTREYTQCGGTGCAGWLCTPFTSSITNCYRDVCSDEVIVSDYGGLDFSKSSSWDDESYGVKVYKNDVLIDEIGKSSWSGGVIENNERNSVSKTYFFDGKICEGMCSGNIGIQAQFSQQVFKLVDRYQYPPPSSRLNAYQVIGLDTMINASFDSLRESYLQNENASAQLIVSNTYKPMSAIVKMSYEVPTFVGSATKTEVYNVDLKVNSPERVYAFSDLNVVSFTVPTSKVTDEVIITPSIEIYLLTKDFSGVNYDFGSGKSEPIDRYDKFLLLSKTEEPVHIKIISEAEYLRGVILSKETEILLLKMTLDSRVEYIDNLTRAISDANKQIEVQGVLLDKLNMTMQENAYAIRMMQDNLTSQALLIIELDRTIRENVLIMNNMDKTIAEMFAMIEILSKDKKELDLYVNELLKNIAFQESKVIELNSIIQINIQRISQMNATLQEKLAIIDALSKNIEEKEAMIVEMINNLRTQEEKIQVMKEVISGLERDYSEVKDELLRIREKLGSAEDRVNFLLASVDVLQLSNSQFKDLLNSYESTIAEDKLLLERAHLKEEELLKILEGYKNDLAKEIALVNEVNLSNQQLLSVLENYEDRLREMQETTVKLNESNRKLAEMILNYKEGLNTSQEIMNKLNISNRNLQKLVKEYDERLDKIAKYMSELEISNSDLKEIINNITKDLREQELLYKKALWERTKQKILIGTLITTIFILVMVLLVVIMKSKRKRR